MLALQAPATAASPGPAMPQTEVLIYREADGTCPLVEWLDGLPPRARARCVERLALLEERGNELRRPHADYLDNGIYELRVRYFKVQYRMLYFFHGSRVAVVSHGLAKEGRVPSAEISRAVERAKLFRADPEAHTFTGEG